jgi:hypothetical protein
MLEYYQQFNLKNNLKFEEHVKYLMNFRES